jgi:hypothetical protein
LAEETAEDVIDNDFIITPMPVGGLPKDIEGFAPGTTPVALYELHEDLIQYYSRQFTLSFGLEMATKLKPSYAKVVKHLYRCYGDLRVRGQSALQPVGGRGKRSTSSTDKAPLTLSDLINRYNDNERCFAAQLADLSNIMFSHRAIVRAVGWPDLLGTDPPRSVVTPRRSFVKKVKRMSALPLTGKQLYARKTAEERRDAQLSAAAGRNELPLSRFLGTS